MRNKHKKPLILNDCSPDAEKVQVELLRKGGGKRLAFLLDILPKCAIVIADRNKIQG